jgi:hypothetical protein
MLSSILSQLATERPRGMPVPISAIHRCRVAGTALVMATDEFHLGVLTTPKAATSQ